MQEGGDQGSPVVSQDGMGGRRSPPMVYKKLHSGQEIFAAMIADQGPGPS